MGMEELTLDEITRNFKLADYTRLEKENIELKKRLKTKTVADEMASSLLNALLEENMNKIKMAEKGLTTILSLENGDQVKFEMILNAELVKVSWLIKKS